MQPRSGLFVALISKDGPNVVESAAMLTELATRMHDTEHAGDDTTYEKLISYNGPLPAELVPGNVSNPSDSARRLLAYNGDRQSEAVIMA